MAKNMAKARTAKAGPRFELTVENNDNNWKDIRKSIEQKIQNPLVHTVKSKNGLSFSRKMTRPRLLYDALKTLGKESPATQGSSSSMSIGSSQSRRFRGLSGTRIRTWISARLTLGTLSQCSG